MSAARIFLAAVLAFLLAAPAQAQVLDDDLLDDIRHCLETWPDDHAMQLNCVYKRIDRRRILSDPVEWHLPEDVLDGPPLQCADEAREGTGGLQSCLTEELNLAGTPPAERP